MSETHTGLGGYYICTVRKDCIAMRNVKVHVNIDIFCLTLIAVGSVFSRSLTAYKGRQILSYLYRSQNR